MKNWTFDPISAQKHWLCVLHRSTSPRHLMSTHKIWGATWENVLYDMRYKNSNQPAFSCSLIRVFVICMKKLFILGYLKCAQWRFWSDWECATHEDTFHPWISKMCPVKILIRLRMCYTWRNFSSLDIQNVPSEGSDQTENVLHMKKFFILEYPKCAQWRFWSDWECATHEEIFHLWISKMCTSYWYLLIVSQYDPEFDLKTK